MLNDTFFKDYCDFTTFQFDAYGKSTLFENKNVLVGLNCLEPGQDMMRPPHKAQSRFYVVLEGYGMVQVGDEEREATMGMVIWVPPGQDHRIFNIGARRMVLLAGIVPGQPE